MRATLAVALATLALGCASGSAIEVEKPAELPVFTPEREAQVVWYHDTGRGVGKNYLRLRPQLDGDTLYVVDRGGRVRAFAAATGKQRWEVDLGVVASTGPGVGGGQVLIGTQKGKLIALDSSTGARLWDATLTTEVLAPAVAYAGTVVVQTGDGKVAALNSGNGRRRWVFERSEPALSLRGTSRPRVLGDFVITGFASGKIAALDLRDGRLLWELAVAQPHGRNEIERLVDVDASVLVVRDTLFAASYQGKIVAVDLRTGRIAWSRDASVYQDMDADERNLYVSDDKGIVMALDQASGASIWRQDKLRGRGLSAPARVEDYVLVGDYEGYVHWLAREDGRLVARLRAGVGAVRAQAVVQGKVAFFADQTGGVGALALR